VHGPAPIQRRPGRVARGGEVAVVSVLADAGPLNDDGDARRPQGRCSRDPQDRRRARRRRRSRSSATRCSRCCPNTRTRNWSSSGHDPRRWGLAVCREFEPAWLSSDVDCIRDRLPRPPATAWTPSEIAPTGTDAKVRLRQPRVRNLVAFQERFPSLHSSGTIGVGSCGYGDVSGSLGGGTAKLIELLEGQQAAGGLTAWRSSDDGSSRSSSLSSQWSAGRATLALEQFT